MQYEPATSFVERVSSTLRSERGKQYALTPEVGEGKAARVVVGCSDGGAISQRAAAALLAGGFENAVVLEGGVQQWTCEELPLEKDEEGDEEADSTF